jgi:hypothetical protein
MRHYDLLLASKTPPRAVCHRECEDRNSQIDSCNSTFRSQSDAIPDRNVAIAKDSEQT